MPSTDALRAASRDLAARPPREVLAWTLRTFPGRAALSVSFGGGGLVLAHLLSELAPEVPLLFLDTGFHFAETLAFRDRFAARYGLTVTTLHPAEDPGPLYATDPDRCCAIRKVAPMQRALDGVDGWISALRRDQSSTRGTIETIEPHEHEGRTIAKVHPLAGWTRADVDAYLRDHDVPTHPLLADGYASIGCAPCTRRTAPGEHERAGRWSGSAKTECGLHTFTDRVSA